MKNILSIRLIKLTAVVLMLFSLATSCKKLIEVPANPASSVSTTQIFADSVDVMGVIAGIYHNFGATDQGTSILSTALPEAVCLTGDEMYTTITYNPDVLQLYNNAILTNSGSIYTLWSTAYTPIYQLNACLEGMAASNGISTSLKKQLTGEVKVVRALYYFHLVNLFGDVPLITSTDYKSNAVRPRTSTDSVYGQIIADLSDAMQLLPASYPSAGRARPNVYTAMALLSKVYLYRKQYELSANLASQVINSHVYGLEPDLNNVFLDGSNEAIWQLPATGLYYPTSMAMAFVPYPGSPPSYPLTNSLVAAFEPGDHRLSAWIGSTTIDDGSGNLTNYSYPNKYKNTSLSASTVEDQMMVRLGDLILIRAEALAQQNKLDSAKADLNLVRIRAGLGNTAAGSQSDLVAGILHERQVELFCEAADRWYDLKRTGTVDAVLGTEKSGWQSYDALYPIPITDIHADPYLTQNPHYN